jgi:hypothetical protein
MATVNGAADTPTPEAARCLNCGEPVQRNYCPNCGQQHIEALLPASQLLHEAVDEFVKLDSKLGKTVVPLLTKPGFLTNEYIAGRRVRYVGPFRIYFIIGAVYFLLFSLAHYNTSVMSGLETVIEHAHPSHVAADSEAAGGDHMAHHVNSDGLDESRLHKHFAALKRTTEWFVGNQTLITFLLVPVAALVLKLLYISSKRLYIEHLVFAVHIQAFLFCLLIPTLLPWYRQSTYAAAMVLALIYLYFAMRAVYGNGAAATVAKCSVMAACYVGVMAIICYAAFLVIYSRVAG